MIPLYFEIFYITCKNQTTTLPGSEACSRRFSHLITTCTASSAAAGRRKAVDSLFLKDIILQLLLQIVDVCIKLVIRSSIQVLLLLVRLSNAVSNPISQDLNLPETYSVNLINAFKSYIKPPPWSTRVQEHPHITLAEGQGESHPICQIVSDLCFQGLARRLHSEQVSDTLVCEVSRHVLVDQPHR